MYYTGINPMNGKEIYVTTDYREKQLQRALLQYSRPENANLVREALKKAGREDLIGNSAECLVRPAFGQAKNAKLDLGSGRQSQKNKSKFAKSLKSAGARTAKGKGKSEAAKGSLIAKKSVSGVKKASFSKAAPKELGKRLGKQAKKR